MTSQYRHRRTSNPATVFPNPIEPGEITVNTANRQIAVGDAASATLGTPKALIAIRYFDTAAQYVVNDFVVNGTALYRAKNATGPGAFVAADWAMMVGTIDPQYVAKAGDVMTGALSLPAVNPTAGVHATNKTYVDNLVATKSSVVVSDVPPTPVPVDGTLWYNTLDGQMYIRYNDGNSTQWVIAAPQPDINQFVNKTGDTMKDYLIIQGTNPTLYMDKTGASQSNMLKGGSASKDRWQVVLGDATAEAGSNVGSNFSISRMNDSGGYIDTPLLINRASGVADFSKKPTVAGAAWAAPMDALAYSGLQINGSFEVSQEKGSASTSINDYVVDGWRHEKVGTLGIIAAQYAASPFTTAGLGFPLSFAITVPTAQVSLGANDYCMMICAIEGYRIGRLSWGTANAQPITIAFWTAHNKTGVYSVGLKNRSNNRSCAATYTQNVAGIPEYKVITFPGDTAGTWNTDNTTGIQVMFNVACGSSFIAPAANTWYAANYLAAPGQVNGVDSTSQAFRLAGVVVLPGIEAPSAARSPYIMRPYDQELVTCKRYYQRPDVGIGIAYSTSAIQFNVRHQGMRANPTLGNPGVVQVTDTGSAFTQSSPSTVISSYPTPNSGLYSLGNFTPGLLALRTYLCVPNNSAPLTADARL